ncbi:MAG TPA: Zn-dependent hydrolase [Stellaceae bacterium]|nr:Zn-dependent hydrolase [Stellaceae bacterium]
MQPQRHDIEPEIVIADQLFADLQAASASRLGITRASYGEGEDRAHALMRALGRRLGLEHRVDAAGNLYLTLPGRNRALPGIMIGSHLDSVPEGGNFDGAAGVVAGLAVAARYRRLNRVPNRDITVMGIRAEELSWFPAPYIGSRAAFGMLEPEVLDRCLRHDTGKSLGDHMRLAGFDPEAIRRGERQLAPDEIRCYFELHIEQGPVLVQHDIPVGIVTGIRGNLRYRYCHILGAYAHAGAEPRSSRRDAVFAGSAFVERLEATWLDHERHGKDLVCTVGQFHTDAEVHTMTKVPGELWFTMDIRSADNPVLLECDRTLRQEAERIGAERGVTIDLGPFTNALPGPIDPDLRRTLLRLAEELGVSALEMPSGAGHDAAVFAISGVPTAMIFVRNEHGSHNPHEAMRMDDFAEGLRLLMAAVEASDASPSTSGDASIG